MFPCCSLLLPPASFPHCAHKSVPCLHLHCCPADRFVSTSFLDFIYMCSYLSFSSWHTSLCITGSRFIHLIRTDSNAFLCWAIFYCIYVTQFLYTFICWWTSKLLQSCPTLCNPIDDSPPGSPVPGILQERTLEWVAISFSNAWKWKVKVKSLSLPDS